jgi:hypothetical protein
MSKKNVAEEGLPAEDIFKKKSDSTIGGGDKKPVPTMPTTKEFAEAHTPELSQDTFVIADKTFQLRMSSIKTQKIMACALDAITEMIKKIDLLPIFKTIQDKLNRTVTSDNDSNEYLDMVELIKDVISHGGLSNIMNTVLDIYVGVVFAICNSQDRTVSRDWIEENISFYDAQKIFFIQMEKDRIGGRVIGFLHMLTRQIVSEEGKTI